jgi:hypothetical protein
VGILFRYIQIIAGDAEVANDFQLQGSLDFHDLNEDEEVTEAFSIQRYMNYRDSEPS